MKVLEKNKGFKIINGDSLKVLDTIPENSIDAIITDPPYGLTSITKRFGKENSAPNQYGKDGSFARLSKGFMGKEWDGSGIEYNVDLWRKALKVLKPGGYLLAFGGTRTYHRIACAIEDAGFEIRDCIMWLYGSGFPKSMNIGLAIDKKNGVESQVVGKGKSGKSYHAFQSEYCSTAGEFQKLKANNEWAGWGTALKPAYEPIIVARKPCEKSVIENVQKYRVGGINIDECRVGTETIKGGTMPDLKYVGEEQKKQGNGHKMSFGQVENAPRLECDDHTGRFPANVILTYDENDEKEVCGGMPKTTSNYNTEGKHETEIHRENQDFLQYGYKERIDSGFNDEGSAARYFYCAKASKKDRDSGLIEFEEKNGVDITGRKENTNGLIWDGGKYAYGNAFAGAGSPKKNIHPTVKPVELMQYLIKLVCPKGATILDIFNGSGSTGKAVAFENRERDANYKYIGIELDKEYCRISESRIDYALNQYKYDIMEEIKENKDKGQLSLFDYNNEEEGD